jgi:hypothetical protein
MRWKGKATRIKEKGVKIHTIKFAFKPTYIVKHDKWIWLERYTISFNERAFKDKHGHWTTIEDYVHKYPNLVKEFLHKQLPEDLL